MAKISKEEYVRRVLNFAELHRDSYSKMEFDYITKNASWGLTQKYIPSILRQIYEEVAALDDENNAYHGFVELLQENFDIDRDIIEIGGGIVPSLAKRIAAKQKKGTITVYDPRLITSIEHSDNLILKREMFSKETPIENAKIIIGFMPCEATNLLIDVACKNNLDFMIALCEGGMRPGYEWLETDDEWISHVKLNANDGMRDKKMGVLKEASLEKYDIPYPVIYNKKNLK